jgi:hypothetical protein
MFNFKTLNDNALLLANNGYSAPFHGAVRKQKNKTKSENHNVFGHKKSNINKPRYGCADCGRNRKIALKSYHVPGPGLHYKCADCDEELGYSSKKQRGKNPEIYVPPEDCILCGGTGCTQCPR